MDPRKLSRSALVDFTTNAATAIANGKVSGFPAAQNTSVSDAMTDANAVLAAADLNAVEARAASLQATQLAEDAAAVVLKLHGETKASMKGVDSPAGDYDAVGYDPPDTVRSPVQPQTPSDLMAVPESNGVNALSYRGNNPNQSVTYAIEAKIGDTAPYTLIGTSRSQKYKHVGVERGQFYQYRVRAQSARGVVSGWSNEAVCYGI